ncbi:glycosyltransferase family 2 protein [Congregibacter variabilis]|uniref:Glycosyltransferase family 2 protein n=1 Tax=Congregibacter variabilis TaxID=3081200 RepID=A0ABZ0I0W5_9GAMM|nr:glycosyltransferase family 2 protein [Congregibacter sp. IMCC43200]
MTAQLSVIVPVYNESETLPQFHSRVMAVLDALNMPADLLYVDDGSDDGSSDWLDAQQVADARVAVLRLSRNFGKEAAMSAGFDYASGDAVVVIDADLQDPPELIPTLIEHWRAGFDVVYATRESRQGESWFKRQSAALFYRLMDRLSDVPIPRDTGDFRLLSRRAVDALAKLREQHRYMKGLYAWIGYPQKAVPYAREARASGRSKWSYWRLWNLALEGITSFSAAPLKLATWLGLFTSVIAFAYGLFFLLRTLFFGNPVPGYPSLMVVILFLGGVQLVCLGIIGEYLARTYNESKARQLYFVMDYRPGGKMRPRQAVPEQGSADGGSLHNVSGQ